MPDLVPSDNHNRVPTASLYGMFLNFALSSSVLGLIDLLSITLTSAGV